MMKSKWIILYSIITILLLYVLGQVFELSYFYSLGAKLLVFLALPILLNRWVFKHKVPFKLTKHHLSRMVLISLLVVVVIIGAFLLLESFMDISTIKDDLSGRQKIDNAIYLFPIFYTIFANSFIEEFFFRGFIFTGLKNRPFIAAVFSSLCFALYHMAIIATWFTLPLMLVTMAGLFLGGLIFSYFVHKTDSLFASYFIHMSADIGVVLVGVFGMGIFS